MASSTESPLLQEWNKTWGGASGEDGMAVAVAADGSVYLAGVTDSFGAGSNDAFLAKYNAAGVQQWNVTWGNANSDQGRAVAVATDGSVYLAGSTNSFGAGNFDAFLAKYNAAGMQQ
ncbi:MAG: hypothetical protein GYA24_11405 [Candidatus Lokiarchaeota archaeon]|nr:hypothetical protein [Candidatus Lokiarchaeota archaeon]